MIVINGFNNSGPDFWTPDELDLFIADEAYRIACARH